MSALLCERVCNLGQALVFSEAEELLNELVGVSVSAKQIERLCLYFGDQVAEQIPEAADAIEGQRLYAMLDGSRVLTCEKGWKEVKLGRLFAESDHEKIGNRGAIAHSCYVAHLGSKDVFLPEFERALSRARHQQLVLVADGASWIWEWAEREHPEAVQILDYYHVKQALWRYAQVHFTSKRRRLSWLEQQEDRLFEDAVEEVIEEVTSFGYRSLSDLEEQGRLLSYLKNNQVRMRYGRYRKQGLMIGSGPIESAHRNVLQQRMKLAGQRWSEPGAQAVMNLRVLHKSGHWSALIKETGQLKPAA